MINYRDLNLRRTKVKNDRVKSTIPISNNMIFTILTGMAYVLIAVFQFCSYSYYGVQGWYINISIEELILIGIIVYFLILSILPFFQSIDFVSLDVKNEKEKMYYVWAIISIVISVVILSLILEMKRTNNYESLYLVFFLFLFLFVIFSNIIRKVFGKNIIINKFELKITNLRRTIMDIFFMFLIVLLLVGFLGIYTSIDKKEYIVFEKDGRKAFVICEYKDKYIASYYYDKTNVKEVGYFFINPTDIKLFEEKKIGKVIVK